MSSPLAEQTNPQSAIQNSQSGLRIKLENALPAKEVAGLNLLPGKSNYLIGSDPNNGVMTSRITPESSTARYTPASTWLITARNERWNMILLLPRVTARMLSPSALKALTGLNWAAMAIWRCI